MRAPRFWCWSRPLTEFLPSWSATRSGWLSSGLTSRHLVARRSKLCWDLRGGGGRDPHADLSCPLLIVYTSGTTGRPKGAVLRQEALFWNGVMSQHMHDMTSEDHILTVLPFFHVGGLNIQTTPALHLGATVTIHARFTPDMALAAIARERPTLTVMVPAIIQAVQRPSRPGHGRSLVNRRPSPPARPSCRRI